MNETDKPKGATLHPRILRPGQCENPPCETCPDWPAYCMTCGFAKAITDEQYAEEMALLAAEVEEERANAPYLTQDSTGQVVLIANIPHTKECAGCGMDDSMESDLELCPTCGCCLRWTFEEIVGSCCICPKNAAES